MDEVERAKDLACDIGAGFLIEPEVGRSIDIAKLASVRANIPFLSVPTAASHDGICSAQASLTVNGETMSVQAQAPLAIVADTKIISQAPARLLAAGCGDIISNYTAILDWKLRAQAQKRGIQRICVCPLGDDCTDDRRACARNSPGP
jgi:glycerol-1-phosphate dehydrogenase [NAD(P)+]